MADSGGWVAVGAIGTVVAAVVAVAEFNRGGQPVTVQVQPGAFTIAPAPVMRNDVQPAALMPADGSRIPIPLAQAPAVSAAATTTALQDRTEPAGSEAVPPIDEAPPARAVARGDDRRSLEFNNELR